MMNGKKITQKELEKFLKKHKLWLIDDPKGERANLRGANLTGADLTGADLRGANLTGADLTGADLRGANLMHADLTDADLRVADLTDVDLWGANLTDVNLTGANLTGANLRGANLTGANLRGANLRGAKDIYLPIACPEEGSFIGFKKVQNHLIKLEIPAEAKRCSATSRKCRCEYAKVLSITDLTDGDETIQLVTNTNYETCIYEVGKVVYPDSFDEDRWNECSHGIHFFITRDEAVNY